jgi:hypothetical protein
MTIPTGGGEPRVILEPGARAPDVAGDGRIVYLRGAGEGHVSIVVAPPGGGAARPLSASLPAGAYARPQFSPDGKRVAVVRAGSELIEVDVATGRIVRSFTHGGDGFEHAVYSGDEMVIARRLWAGDLWLADVR